MLWCLVNGSVIDYRKGFQLFLPFLMLSYQSCVMPLLSSEVQSNQKVWKTTKAPLTLPILSQYTLNIHVHNLTVTSAFYICAPQFRGTPLLITESHRKVMVPGLSLVVPWLPVAITMGFTIWIVWTHIHLCGILPGANHQHFLLVQNFWFLPSVSTLLHRKC